MWMGYFPIPRMYRLMNKEVKWCTPDHSAIQWLNIFAPLWHQATMMYYKPLRSGVLAPLEFFPLCLFSACSLGWWVLASHQTLAHLEAVSKTETSAPLTCTRPAYLLGQPFPFLFSPVDRSHLPQVLQSYLGLAMKEEPSRWLWQPPGTKRRVENEWHWNGHCDGLWWPLGTEWIEWYPCRSSNQSTPSFTFQTSEKRKNPCCQQNWEDWGTRGLLFFAAHLSENFCSVLRDDMDLQVSTDLVLNLVLTPVGGFFACFVSVVCCS